VKILSWNIQATKGCDDRFDAARIVDKIKGYGELDVICLQEIARHIPDLNGDDQLEIIVHYLPNYRVVWGAGFSAYSDNAHTAEFGNLSLVKPALLLHSKVHILPSPVINELQIPRVMVEVTLNYDEQRISVYNTHLSFHSERERIAQLASLTTLRDEILAMSPTLPHSDAEGPYRFANRCQDVILCGDLNVDSDSSVFTDSITAAHWVDCWAVQSANLNDAEMRDRQPTCGCYDRIQWPQGPHVRDYFLATKNLADKTARVSVDTETDASDHQPVLLELAL